MTQKQFDKIILEFYKLYDIIDKIVNIGENNDGEENDKIENNIEVLYQYFDKQEETINMLRDINNDWVKKFDDDILKGDEDTRLPDVFVLFKEFVTNIKNENYIECGKIKNKLINEF